MVLQWIFAKYNCKSRKYAFFLIKKLESTDKIKSISPSGRQTHNSCQMPEFLSLSHYAHLSWSFIYLSGLHNGTNIKRQKQPQDLSEGMTLCLTFQNVSEAIHVLFIILCMIQIIQIKDRNRMHKEIHVSMQGSFNTLIQYVISPMHGKCKLFILFCLILVQL